MISVLVGASSISILFACISIVSGVTLAILVFNESRQANNNNSMVSFNRHLDALSDDSRAYLRQQVRNAQERQKKR